MFDGKLTDVEGLLVGQVQDREARTGCTVVLCPPEGAVAVAEVRGAAPGTRETDLLKPGCLVEKINAVLLSGGSAFGLNAAGGVMKYLEEKGIGFNSGAATVPIVPGAVLYDLSVGRSDVRPDADMGYAACENAGVEVEQGAYGAGCGATVGKLFGMQQCSPGGTGTASLKVGGATVSAIVCVNALGNVTDMAGNTLAGARGPDGQFIDEWQTMLNIPVNAGFGNTTIGVVATDAPLDKGGLQRLVGAAHNGLALTIRPVHTQADGDTLFALSTGKGPDVNLTALCVAAAEVMARAVQNAVTAGKEA